MANAGQHCRASAAVGGWWIDKLADCKRLEVRCLLPIARPQVLFGISRF